MTTVLVTGSGGQLGKTLQLMAKDSHDSKWYFKKSNDLDVTNHAQVLDFLEQNKVTHIINCAAYTAVDFAEEEQVKAFKVNALAVKKLAEFCTDFDITLIHLSTDFVFDGSKGTPYTELDIPNPVNVYGASKLKGEQYIQNCAKKYFIFRTSWLYSIFKGNFLTTILDRAKANQEINVVNWQKGSPTNAEDLALFLIDLVVSSSRDYGLYHFSNSGSTTWYDFAIAIFKETGLNPNISAISTESKINSTVKRPKYSVLDTKKTTETFGNVPNSWYCSMKKALKKINRNESRS